MNRKLTYYFSHKLLCFVSNFSACIDNERLPNGLFFSDTFADNILASNRAALIKWLKQFQQRYPNVSLLCLFFNLLLTIHTNFQPVWYKVFCRLRLNGVCLNRTPHRLVCPAGHMGRPVCAGDVTCVHCSMLVTSDHADTCDVNALSEPSLVYQ